MLMLYSNSLSLSHPLISQLLKLLFTLCKSDSIELFDMSKAAFFHIVNRISYNQKS